MADNCEKRTIVDILAFFGNANLVARNLSSYYSGTVVQLRLLFLISPGFHPVKRTNHPPRCQN